MSFAHVAYAFINGTYIGSAHGNHDVKNFTLKVPVELTDGVHNLSILSVMVGLPDSGAFLERRYAGLSNVKIRCNDAGEMIHDLSNSAWGYKVGLLGEELEIYGQEYEGNGTWSTEFKSSASQPPLTWYKTRFDAPEGDDPVALDLSTMGKGEAWINGNSIGRYWVSFLTPKGSPSQTLYHVPHSFLKTTDNQLVVLEEGEGGNPLRITVNTISTMFTAVDSHFQYHVTRQFHEEK